MPSSTLKMHPKNEPQLTDTRKSVLLVDDIELNLLLLEAILNSCDYDLCLARDGEEALEAANDRSFDAIVLDLKMPRRDGFSTIAKLREIHEWAKNIPIIAISANSPDELRENCSRAGFDDFIAKPIRPEFVRALIAEKLETRPSA